MKVLQALNNTDYFCSCGIFPKDGDTCTHWSQPEPVQPTTKRHVRILLGLGLFFLGLAILAFGFVKAASQ